MKPVARNCSTCHLTPPTSIPSSKRGRSSKRSCAPPRHGCWKPSKRPSHQRSPPSLRTTPPLGSATAATGYTNYEYALKVGTDSITAVYAGDSNFAASKSKAVSQVVGKATTTTALASSVNPSSVGQSVTFTASVAPEFSGTATGSVTFYDGTTLLKTVALSGGAAKYTTKTLTSGSHTITATYNGSTTFDGSSSAPLT